jgi:hypothetical protein
MRNTALWTLNTVSRECEGVAAMRNCEGVVGSRYQATTSKENSEL